MSKTSGRMFGLCVLLAACAAPALRPVPVSPADSIAVLDTIHIMAARMRPTPDREAYQAARSASRDSLLRELAAARQRWAGQGAPRVRYRWVEACYCIFSVGASSDIIVESVGDSIISIANQRTIATTYASSGRRRPTISLLMKLAEQAIRGDADEIIVTFDPLLGIPTRVYVDVRIRVTDDEEDIRVVDIHVVR